MLTDPDEPRELFGMVLRADPSGKAFGRPLLVAGSTSIYRTSWRKSVHPGSTQDAIAERRPIFSLAKIRLMCSRTV